MNFYTNQLFHVYNQGNNRNTIFFSDENYEYFRWKMKAYLLPFVDVISYCLMPTHFHWQIYVHKDFIERKTLRNHVEEVERQRMKNKYGEKGFTNSSPTLFKVNENSLVSLNEAIGILQRTYTRALNKEKNWTGSVFRADCKSKDGWSEEFITVAKSNGKADFRFTADINYGYTCMKYIHENPIKAGLVNATINWKYSSARGYAGLENDGICNVEMGRTIIGIK